MKQINSVVTTVDGESKVGKTVFIDAIANGATFQTQMYQEAVSPEGPFGDLELGSTREWIDAVTFNGIYKVTAGNAFRAAALYVRELEAAGQTKTMFDDDDAVKLWELLGKEGAADILQTDPEIEGRVSKVAQMTGVRALCETIFCNEVTKAYNAEGGSNLVIVDARNPIAVFQRNDILGENSQQIRPNSIVPLFIDTPVGVAASRLKGDYQANVARIAQRRQDDRQRPEYPFEDPEKVIRDSRSWLRQFPHPSTMNGIALPLYIQNGPTLSIGGIHAIAERIAATAHDTAGNIYRSLQPGYVPPKEEMVYFG
jgi:hypothetical protein